MRRTGQPSAPCTVQPFRIMLQFCAIQRGAGRDHHMQAGKQSDEIALDAAIPDRFAMQVHRHGERPAVVTEHGAVTYRELDHLASAVAAALLANGHSHGQTVAILLEQGILQVAAILGVLKAGGIYVPLDLALGRQRLRKILQHAESGIVLTDQLNRSMATLIGCGRVRVLNIEENPDHSREPSPAIVPAADDFACIYYTSGTTGEPKGVVDTHRNVLHNITRYTKSLDIDCNDRLTLLQSCGFSGAVSNIFSALLNGALLLPFDVRSRGVSALAAWLAAQKPTIYHSVPTLFRQLLRYCDALPSLRIIRLEGDLVRAIDLETFNGRFDGHCTQVNGLGATETGLTAQHFIRHGTAVPNSAVPVGKPTRDVQINVVDERQQPVQQGHYGEIVITSRYLANGYWRRPDLTNSVFSVVSGETRCYRTGDLGRFDADGLLELHGRVDMTARIRGEWVDLGALESRLLRCTGVHDVIAGMTSAGVAESELTAWIVPEPGATPSFAQLRAALRAEGWPWHAIPTRILFLANWPLDANGKVDRRALPVSDETTAIGEEPETPMEKLVAEVFAQILATTPVSRTDDFFALGGDSLKAVEACLELERRTGSKRALGAIQHAPRVAELAHLLSAAVGSGCLVPLQPQGDGPALFCVHAHMGHVFNLRHLALQFAPGQKFFGLQARGLDGTERPDTTVEAMATTYVSRIRLAQPDGPYLIAGYCFGSWVAVEIARQLCEAGEQIDGLFLIDPQVPPALLPSGRADDLRRRARSFLARVKNLDARCMMPMLLRKLSSMRLRLLRRITRSLPAGHWLTHLALQRPADAIAVMQSDYRPLSYGGDVLILLSRDNFLDADRHEAWKTYISGNLEIASLVGAASDLLREPYARDLAAHLLMRIEPRAAACASFSQGTRSGKHVRNAVHVAGL